MALTKAQRIIINELILAIAEQRIFLEKEIEKDIVDSIQKRNRSRELEAAYQKGVSLLKPREIKKEVKDAAIRMETQVEKI